jgi:hypothetical protein
LVEILSVRLHRHGSLSARMFTRWRLSAMNLHLMMPKTLCHSVFLIADILSAATVALTGINMYRLHNFFGCSKRIILQLSRKRYISRHHYISCHHCQFFLTSRLFSGCRSLRRRLPKSASDRLSGHCNCTIMRKLTLGG